MARGGYVGRAGTGAPIGGGSSIYILGLDKLQRDLRAMDREYGTSGVRALQRELQKAADMVADHARNVTAQEAGMVGNQPRRLDRDGNPYGKRRKYYRPGRTVRGGSIKGYVRKNSGVVTVRATARGGFRYPWMYEFGTSQRNTDPKRPFLYPALNEKRDEVMETLAEGIERVARKHGFRGGGIA